MHQLIFVFSYNDSFRLVVIVNVINYYIIITDFWVIVHVIVFVIGVFTCRYL